MLNGEPDKKRELEIVYGHARQDRYELWTSTLAIVEARRLKDEEHDPKPLTAENLRKIEELFRQPFVKPIPLAVDIAESARRLFRETPGLKKWQDAIHLESALRWNVAVFHTYDNDDLLHLNQQLMCRSGELLTICYPDETTDGPLFAQSGS